MANELREAKPYQEIWNRVFDTSDDKLCITTSNTSPPTELLSVQEIMIRAFDSTNNRFNTK